MVNGDGLLFQKELNLANYVKHTPSPYATPPPTPPPLPSLPSLLLSHTHVRTLALSPSLFLFPTAAVMTQRSCRNYFCAFLFLFPSLHARSSSCF